MGIVTDEMLSMPKAPFLVVGLLEALGAATGMAAGGNACPELHFLIVFSQSSSNEFHQICFVNCRNI